MKRFISIVLFLAFASGASFAQTSIQGREVNARAFGAKCDASTNDLVAISAAISAVTSTGGIVDLPDGTCVISGTLTVPGGVWLRGKDKFVSILKSSNNGVILDLVAGSGSFAARGPKITDLWVDGSDSGSSQIGIRVTDASAVRDTVISDVTISDCGSHGLYIGNAFSSEFRNISSTSNVGYNFFYLAPNMPANYFYGLYSGDVNVAAPAGYRIKQGDFTCWACNGVDTVPGTAYWAVLGGWPGDIDGDVTQFFASAKFTDCNIEGAPTAGIFSYPGSGATVDGISKFVGLSGSSGSWKAMLFDTDASLTPENAKRWYIADTVTFANSPASYYANSQPIWADGLPPLSVNGRGPQIAGGGAAGMIGTFYNTATSRTEMLPRVDAYAPTIELSGSASYTAPGPRTFIMSCALTCTLTLPSPNFYQNGNEVITVINRSITGINVTIAANGGAGVNGSTYIMSVQGGSVQLYPDFTNLDWRVVGNRIGAGVANTYPLFDSTNTISASGSKLTNSGPNLLSAATLLFSTDNTYDIGSSGDNRPNHVYVATDITAPKIFNVGGGASYTSGSATPEGAVTAEPGSIYLRTNGSWYLKATGSGPTGWVLAFTSGGTGITSLNALTASTQTFATGTSGTDFNISSATSTHTFNIPDAGASARGLVTTGTQTLAGAKTVTSVFTANPGTTPANAFLIDINSLGSPGTRDSNWLIQRGRSNDGSTHLTEWKQYVDVTSNAGASTWTLESRIDAASFSSRFTVTDAAAVSAGAFSGTSFTNDDGSILDADVNAATGFTVAGAAASGQYLRGNGTRAVFGAIQAGDLPATVVLTSAANTYTAGQKQTFSPNGTTAGFNVGSVSADPSVPVNGDCWYQSTANEYRCRINGSTVAIGSGSGGTISGSGTTGKLAKWTGASSVGDSIVSESGSTLTVTGIVAPEADNTRDLGTTSLRWKTLHVGPGSVVVHNDATNTLKATLGFSGSTAQLVTDAATPLQLKVGSTTGVFLNTSGAMGFNLATTPNGNFDFRQITNGDQVINVRRVTDTTPSGNFLNFENAAGIDLFTVDNSGILTAGTIPAARIASGTVAPANGGTGQDTSASTGVPIITAGTWAVQATTGTGNVARGTAPTIAGGSITALTSFGIRSSGTGAFDLTLTNTENLTAGRTLTLTLGDTARTLTMGGNITTAGAFATSGANSLTLTTTGSTNVTLPTTGTLATLAGSEALTNKTVNGNTFTAGTYTLTGAASKTLTFSNSLTLAGTDSTTMTFPATNATVAGLGIAQTFSAVQTINTGTTPSEVLSLDIAALSGGDATRDSHSILSTGRSRISGVSHTPQWKQFVDVTTSAGFSAYTFSWQFDGGGYAPMMTIGDDGNVAATTFTADTFQSTSGSAVDSTINATTGYTISGAGAAGKYLQGNGSAFVSANGPDSGYISGLQLQWDSTTQITIKTGAAQIESTSTILKVTSDLVISPSLSANAWFYCYVYDNSGTPAGECVTTAPATAYIGTARSKTSNTARRYVGAIRTNGSSQIYTFFHNPTNNYYQWLEDTTASPFRVLSGGTATSETSIDATAVMPTTSRQAQLRTINTSTPTGNVFVRASSGGANALTVRVNADFIFPMTTTSAQLFYYLYNVAPSGSFFADVIGFFDLR